VAMAFEPACAGMHEDAMAPYNSVESTVWHIPATPAPADFDALLTRDAAAAALTAAGYPVRSKTLATKATRGGGPPFRRFGSRPLYRWGDLLDWARSRLGPKIQSTSDADIPPHRGAAADLPSATSKRRVPRHKFREPAS
jgi:hypothetical protein